MTKRIKAMVRLEWISDLQTEINTGGVAMQPLSMIGIHALIFIIFNNAKLLNINGDWNTSDSFDAVVEQLVHGRTDEIDSTSALLEPHSSIYDSMFNSVCNYITNSIMASGLSPYGWVIDDWVADDLIKISTDAPAS